MLRHLGAALIRAYQRHLSPRKGYRCAYGVLHGDGTCSSIGLHIMEDQGVFAFFRLMPLQFDACRIAAANLEIQTQEEREERERKWRRHQNRKEPRRGGIDDCDDCELPCSSFEIGLCEGLGSNFECGDCEFGSCD